MYQTKNLGLNITEMPKDTNMAFNFHTDLGHNFEAIDSKTVTHRNITNCLLEVPQRIKYELVDGTLTIKAGSVVIVPYGTTDRTNEFPIGATFLNDNFKVVDTQFADGKFFVWVELVNNISATRTSSDDYTRLLSVYVNTASLGAAVYHNSGTTSPSGNSLFYNTDTNIIDYYTAGVADGNISSLPLGEVVAVNPTVFSSVKSIFNGFGYIGSTIWCDKGIKGLTPNGWNLDGSINNIVQETNNLFTYTLPSDLADNSYITSLKNNFGGEITGVELKAKHRVTYSNEKPADVNNWWFHIDENQWKYVEADGLITKRWWFDFGVFNMEQGVIKSFTTKKPFQAVDYNDYSTKIAELEAKIEALQTALQG